MVSVKYITRYAYYVNQYPCILEEHERKPGNAGTAPVVDYPLPTC